MIITTSRCRCIGCPQFGADHKWEFDRPTGREILRLQKAFSIDINDWEKGVNAAFDNPTSVEAITAILVWLDLLHRRDGIIVPYDDIDFDYADFDFVFDGDASAEEEAADDVEGKGPAPTAPSPRPRAKTRPASTSGRAPKAASSRKSSPTPPTSGAGTG